ncbi:trafficking protein particle complex subunit 6A isoform X1 [Zalophus californianus]|uniref:Trafficking protein particle complex subunit 6A isoform X1 n=1 Tax=Zalophus californianus TaxID=9704 RepID=A0A6J2F4U2_ZALCA|nr:trafficking protein particle complex subunit 6A isoform X1 [Zalophus californianus]
MADAALFEFLHTEMVAELWTHPSDPGPGAAPGDTGLQRGVGHPQVPVQRPVGGRVPKADGQPPHQSPAPTGLFSVPRGPTSCRTIASLFSSGWPRACSIWRKHPSSWPSPAASCEAPSASWASRAWSPPPWHPCPPGPPSDELKFHASLGPACPLLSTPPSALLGSLWIPLPRTEPSRHLPE